MCRLIFMSSKVKMPGIIGIHPFIIESTITAQNTPVNLTYIIHSGFISGYQNRYGDNLKPPTNVYHRMTA